MHDNIIPYVAELAAANIKEEVRQLRLDAFRELQTQINTFANRMYDPRLIADIAETRAKFIMQTTTKTEMQKVLHPDYNNEPPYGIPAEEMIFWCECSLKHPLRDQDAKRYFQLARDYYGEQETEQI